MSEFYLGIDVGTSSVGMACTDEKYNLLRAKGKNCWSVRLFEKSDTGKERRINRAARRRLFRRKQRIKWLQALFAPFIDDELFFIRLKNSQYYVEDKNILLKGDKNALFNDALYHDKDFHKEYPTIYHLRRDLQKSPHSDLRLYYLAFHHIIKYRGHFLFEGGMQEVRDARRLFEDINIACEDIYVEDVPHFKVSEAAKVKDILLDADSVKRQKYESLCELLGRETKIKEEIIKALCGMKISPKILFGEDFADEKSFAVSEFDDETFEGLQAVYENNYPLLAAIRAFIGFVTLEKLLKGSENISSAMVAVYEKHKRDLKLLKDFVRDNAEREDYRRLFKSNKETANYANYVGYTKKGGDKKYTKHCGYDEFLTYLKKFLTSLTEIKDVKTYNDILKGIDAKTFLPQILHSDNGLIPYQLNEAELNDIIKTMTVSHPETKEIADKLLRLFLFRIPYYVGPLAGVVRDDGEKSNWAVRKSDEKITPWNFNEVIDFEKSNEAFMRRMTNKCSYLKGEDVLPKDSFIYQKYNVLNQLNKLRVNEEPISVKLKQQIFNELFMHRLRVTDKAITDLIVRNGGDKTEIILSGKDGEFKANLSSYIKLKNILGEFVDNDFQSGGEVCENIVLWHTLNTDKNLVYKLIEKNYGNIPVIKENLKKLKGLNFKEFGRLSKRLLTELKGTDKETGEVVSVMDLLYSTNLNLNEILYDEKYDFQELIKAENGETDEKVDYSDVEKLYVSPAVKRGICQTLVMADEYVSAIGSAPDKIFVEVSREDGKKGDDGKTSARKKQLSELYKNLSDYGDIIDELNSESITDVRLRQERLYLYFKQLGHCMYSGERINLDLLNSDMYDVDHILPRTYLKDDSIENKILVTRKTNAEKSDTYPLPYNYFKQRPFWKMLKDKKLISEKTYGLLTRTEPLKEEDFLGFINRQKIFTDQTAKCVIELLKRKFPNASVVYSKSKDVADFKNKFGLHKCRETNDLHHARDAYLNIVVGNVYNTCFSNPKAYFYKKGDEWRGYNLKTMFERSVSGAWDKDGSITTVKRIYNDAKSVLVTRYAYCNKGAFYKKITVLPKGDASLPPLKGKGPLNDPAKYGGREAVNNSYFVIIEKENKKGKKEKFIYAVPVLVALQEEKQSGAIKEFLYKSFGIKDFEIIVNKLKQDSLVTVNGYPLWIVGGGGKDPRILFHNALQWFTSEETDAYVKELSKLKELVGRKAEKDDKEEYVLSTNRFGDKKNVINKRNNATLYELILEQLDKDVYRNTYAVLTCFKNFTDVLNAKKENFSSLSTYRQAEFLLNAVAFLKAGSSSADLSLFGEAKNGCVIKRSNNITDVDFVIVYTSPCGLTEKRRKI